MDEKRPKRRKDKYNPYTLSEKEGRYFISFRDGQGVIDGFELDDLSILNEWDRHYEHSELTETTLHNRATTPPESVEDAVFRNLQYETLHKAISQLPETQRRRLVLYYFAGLTYDKIAEMEGCKHPAVIKSVNAAVEKIKKILSE